MKHVDFTLHLTSEWPLGTPYYPIKKVTSACCHQDVRLEFSTVLIVQRSNKIQETVKFGTD
jgi:hypothetical protein